MVESTKDSVCRAAEELGYPSMKPEQLEVVLQFVKGRDVFAVLPTGFGKSLCYACLPSTFDRVLQKERGYSIVVVVTPLLAIMKDQVSVKHMLSLLHIQSNPSCHILGVKLLF